MVPGGILRDKRVHITVLRRLRILCEVTGIVLKGLTHKA